MVCKNMKYCNIAASSPPCPHSLHIVQQPQAGISHDLATGKQGSGGHRSRQNPSGHSTGGLNLLSCKNQIHSGKKGRAGRWPGPGRLPAEWPPAFSAAGTCAGRPRALAAASHPLRATRRQLTSCPGQAAARSTCRHTHRKLHVRQLPNGWPRKQRSRPRSNLQPIRAATQKRTASPLPHTSSQASPHPPAARHPCSLHKALMIVWWRAREARSGAAADGDTPARAPRCCASSQPVRVSGNGRLSSLPTPMLPHAPLPYSCCHL